LTGSVQILGAAGDNPMMALAADADGDGDLDLFIAYYKKPNRIWLNDGKARFSLSDQSISVADSGSMSVADLDKDGDADLLVLVENAPDQIWLNDGRGTFSITKAALGPSKGFDFSDAADIDGDGDPDLVIGNSAEGVRTFINDGRANFITGPVLDTVSYKPCLADIDGDGDRDLICYSMNKGPSLWLNDGRGRFRLTDTSFGSNSGLISILAADLNGDARMDLVFGKMEGHGGHELWLGTK